MSRTDFSQERTAVFSRETFSFQSGENRYRANIRPDDMANIDNRFCSFIWAAVQETSKEVMPAIGMASGTPSWPKVSQLIAASFA